MRYHYRFSTAWGGEEMKKILAIVMLVIVLIVPALSVAQVSEPKEQVQVQIPIPTQTFTETNSDGVTIEITYGGYNIPQSNPLENVYYRWFTTRAIWLGLTRFWTKNAGYWHFTGQTCTAVDDVSSYDVTIWGQYRYAKHHITRTLYPHDPPNQDMLEQRVCGYFRDKFDGHLAYAGSWLRVIWTGQVNNVNWFYCL